MNVKLSFSIIHFLNHDISRTLQIEINISFNFWNCMANEAISQPKGEFRGFLCGGDYKSRGFSLV